MNGDRYSRTVAWLKVSLPLIALAILSTLFLLSRAVDQPVAIPFADSEVQARLNNQQVTGPYFSSVSANGDKIDFVADTVTAARDSVGTNEADNVDVLVEFSTGVEATLRAHHARISIADDRSRLTGDVEITTSRGYVLNTALLLVRMSSVDLNSPGPISGMTPVGPINAGTMHYFVDADTGEGQLVFTNGVKLLYLPEE
ncbi:MAG: hypothetical protein V2I76_11270 [Roseobacter sp.]|jgi:lipopolysaccharide export system protein LptC|nr:hypothetical protein [Roseobacter sp.]